MKFFQLRHHLAIFRQRLRAVKGLDEAVLPYLRQYQIDHRLQELTGVDLKTVDQDIFDEVMKHLNVNMSAIHNSIKERRRNTRE